MPSICPEADRFGSPPVTTRKAANFRDSGGVEGQDHGVTNGHSAATAPAGVHRAAALPQNVCKGERAGRERLSARLVSIDRRS